jgi:hypothetical protein
MSIAPLAQRATFADVHGELIRGRRLGTGLIAASAGYVVAVAAMGLVFASGPPPQLGGHLTDLEQGFALYRWGFVGASLRAPTLTAVLLLLVTAAGVPADSAGRWIGTVLLAAYVPFVTFAYTTQFTLLPGLLALDPDMAALWYLHDARSIPYAMDLTGYAVLGLAAIVLASTMLGRSTLLRWVAAWLVAMGVLSLAALAFHAAGATTAASVSTATSALCTLPVMALAMVEGRRLRATARQAVGAAPREPARRSSVRGDS